MKCAWSDHGMKWSVNIKFQGLLELHHFTGCENGYCFKDSPLCWKSNNPSAQAPWQNYLPYESMAKSKCFWQNRIDQSLRRILQINPEKGGGVKISSDQKNNATFTLKTFWDRQLCFYVKKLFVSEKTQKSELCHFS